MNPVKLKQNRYECDFFGFFDDEHDLTFQVQIKGLKFFKVNQNGFREQFTLDAPIEIQEIKIQRGHSSNSTVWIIVGVCGGVFLVILAILIFVYCRKKQETASWIWLSIEDRKVVLKTILYKKSVK